MNRRTPEESSRPFSWWIHPTRPGPSKPFESKVGTALERHLSAGAALGGRQVAELPVIHEDRPVGPLHHLCRVWAAGSLPASRAGPRLRRDVQTLCASAQGLTTPLGRRTGCTR